MLTRSITKITLALLSAIICPFLESQTTYHFHQETASSGYYLISTGGPDSASTTLTTTDLKGKTGSTWIGNWATAVGVPNSPGTVPAGSSFQFSLWMNKSGNYGTIYPVVTIGKLDSNQNATAWTTVTASTPLTTALTKVTFSFTVPSSETMVRLIVGG